MHILDKKALKTLQNAQKRFEQQFLLYQTIAFLMAENEGFEPPQLLHPNGFRNHPLQPLE